MAYQSPFRQPALAGRGLSKLPELTPEEHDSILGRTLNTSLSMLGAVGNTLDLPGSSVRDLIAGENPFDQWIPPGLGSPVNWTTSSGRTTGRDLFRQAGLAGSDDTWQNFGSGIGLEIALDPLTYMTFGGSALTKGGQLLGKAGLQGRQLMRNVSRARNVGKQAKNALGKRQVRTTANMLEALTDPLYGGKLDPGSIAGVGEGQLERLLKVTGGAQELADELGLGPLQDLARSRVDSLTDAPEFLSRAAGKFGAEGDQLAALLRELGQQKVGGAVGLNLPFQRPFAVLNSPIYDKYAQKADRFGNWLKRTRPGIWARSFAVPGLDLTNKTFEAQEDALLRRDMNIEDAWRLDSAKNRAGLLLEKHGNQAYQEALDSGRKITKDDMVHVTGGEEFGLHGRVTEDLGDGRVKVALRNTGEVREYGLDELEFAKGVDAFDFDDLRDVMEGVLTEGDTIDPEIRRLLTGHASLRTLAEKTRGARLGNTWSTVHEWAQQKGEQLGNRVHWHFDKWLKRYAARESDMAALDLEVFGTKNFDTTDVHQMARLVELTEWPGGTSSINRLFRNADFNEAANQLRELRRGGADEAVIKEQLKKVRGTIHRWANKEGGEFWNKVVTGTDMPLREQVMTPAGAGQFRHLKPTQQWTPHGEAVITSAHQAAAQGAPKFPKNPYMALVREAAVGSGSGQRAINRVYHDEVAKLANQLGLPSHQVTFSMMKAHNPQLAEAFMAPRGTAVARYPLLPDSTALQAGDPKTTMASLLNLPDDALSAKLAEFAPAIPKRVLDDVEFVETVGGGLKAVKKEGKKVFKGEEAIFNRIANVAAALEESKRMQGLFPAHPLIDAHARAATQADSNNAAEVLLKALGEVSRRWREDSLGGTYGDYWVDLAKDAARTKARSWKQWSKRATVGQVVPLEEIPVDEKMLNEAMTELLDTSVPIKSILDNHHFEAGGPRPGDGQFGLQWRDDGNLNVDGAYETIRRFMGLDPWQPNISAKDLAASEDVVGDIKRLWREEVNELGNMRIPKALADDLAREHRFMSDPMGLRGPLRWLDSFTNVFKTIQTTLWPDFHTRNLYGGQYSNFVKGMWSGRSVKSAWRFARGGQVDTSRMPLVLEEARERIAEARSAGMTPNSLEDEAQLVFKEWVWNADLSSSGLGAGRVRGGGGDPSGLHPGAMHKELQTPISNPFTNMIRNTLAKATGHRRRPGTTRAQALNPFNVRGFGQEGVGRGVRQFTEFGVAAAGEDIGELAETMNRVAPFIKLMEDGMDPMAAGKRVKAAQVSYRPQDYTPFELQVMTRAFPFYKWSSRMIPWTIKELLEHPGGRMAQTIKAGTLEEEGKYTPDRVRRGMGLRIGEEKDGQQLFLNQLDLVHEGALSPFVVGNTPGESIMKTGQGLLGMSHPLIKAPLETIFNKQSWSGRDLPEMQGGLNTVLQNIKRMRTGQEPEPSEDVIGRRLENTIQQLVGKPITAARRLTDQRPVDIPGIGDNSLSRWIKYLVNQGTGARITNVDMERERAREAKRRIEEMIEFNPLIKRFSDVYIPEENVAHINQRDLILVQLLHGLERERRLKAKAEKAKKK